MRTILAALCAVFMMAVAVAAEIPNRMDQVKAGEWLLMRDVSGARAGELTKFTVTEVKGSGADKVVVLKIERLGPSGEATETKEIDIPVARYGERMAGLEAKAKAIGRERLTLKGEEIPVVTVTWDDDKEPREFKLWLSPDIPIGGVVKSWSSDPDFPAAELIDYGF